MPNPVVHFEILGRDGEALKAFYQTAFGWNVNSDNPMNYGLVENEGEGIGGGIGGRESDDQPGAMFYIQVPDLQAALDAVEAAGGKTVREPMEIPDMVSLATFADPDGNVIGLVTEM